MSTKPSITAIAKTNPALTTELAEILQRLSVKTGDFVLASGKRSNLYVDCRMTALDGRGAYLIGHLLYDLLKDEHIDAVGGMTLGADPLVTSVIYRSAQEGHPMSGFIVRKEAKGHGVGRQIEGHLEPWMRIALVEDVVTTGGSTLKAIEAIRRTYPQIEIVKIVSLLDRNSGGREAFERLHIPFQPLFSLA